MPSSPPTAVAKRHAQWVPPPVTRVMLTAPRHPGTRHPSTPATLLLNLLVPNFQMNQLRRSWDQYWAPFAPALGVC